MRHSERWRIIDANLNRTAEGLRVLEDIARLLLDDEELTSQLKTLRHELVRGDLSFNLRLVQSRDSSGDVGMDIEVAGEQKGKDLPAVVIANSRRVQESLRTLEEMAKVQDTAPEFDSEKFKHARFQVYTIEQKLLSRLLRLDRLRRLSGLYAIVDTDALKGRSHIEAAEGIIRGGCKIIQLRDKTTAKNELLPIARALKELCTRSGVLFIINDYLDIALAVAADGLHVGQEDLPVKEARQLLPVDMLLGCSTHSVEQAVAAVQDGADHLGFGAIYPTPSKQDYKLAGIERLKQVRQAMKVPLVAIGGITAENAAEVIAAGASAVAVISAILGAADITAATRQLIEKIEVKK
jgi:thiamine-phosphate pyrophosphorylase